MLTYPGIVPSEVRDQITRLLLEAEARYRIERQAVPEDKGVPILRIDSSYEAAVQFVQRGIAGLLQHIVPVARAGSWPVTELHNVIGDLRAQLLAQTHQQKRPNDQGFTTRAAAAVDETPEWMGYQETLRAWPVGSTEAAKPVGGSQSPVGVPVPLDIDSRPLLTAPAAAKLLGVPIKSFYRLLQKGTVVGKKIGKRWMVHPSEVEQHRRSGRLALRTRE